MKASNKAYKTSDYLEWDTATNLVRKLYKDKDYRMSLLIGCGIMFGLRISDIKQLTWSMLLDDDRFTINETKTGKHRTVKINPDFQRHIDKCHTALGIKDDNQSCFLSQKGMVYSTQRINVLFKDIKNRYNLKIDHISTHTMRKTFGRHVFESAGENSQLALVKLSELFNRSNVAITKVYLGLRQEELLETYDLLDF